MATYKRIAKLIVKHRKNALNKQEKEELEKWRNLSDDNQLLFNRLNDTGYVSEKLDELYSVDVDEEWGKIRHMFPNKRRTRFATVMKYAAIVAGLFVTGIAANYIFRKNKTLVAGNHMQPVNVVATDAYRVQLKLANGKIVYLDSTVNGHIALQYRSVIYKQGDVLRYEWSTGDAQPDVEYNTVTTPRTRTFAVELPDGSKAWLNASSSITYPTAFVGKERVVKITGEVYFEVTPHPELLDGAGKKAFVVLAPSPSGNGKGARVEVLGTHFNVNAYTGRPAITTTLLQGKVKVANLDAATDLPMTDKTEQANSKQPEQTVFLVPGQQAQVASDGQLKVITYADIQEAMAWHNEQFVYNDADLQFILQDLARQYDFTVEYRDQVKGHYTLSISRKKGIAAVLKAMELAGGVHFRLNEDDKKIIVSQ